MFVTLITDCKDGNALGRSLTRLSTLFDCNITSVGVNGWDADLEAAGNLIDILDASAGEKGVILVNVAPRHKSGKKWPNGTPFGYFHYKETLVVISIDGLTLSLVKKLKLVDEINLMDIPTVMNSLKQQAIVDQELVDHIIHTQFRSFEFVPRVAAWISQGIEIPSEKYALTNVPDAPNAIWWIDNFGNIKTTLLPEDVSFEPGKIISLQTSLRGAELSKDSATKQSDQQEQSNEITFAPYLREGGDPSNTVKLTCYNRLKDVPEKEPALIIGSSGLGANRFLEIIVQGISAQNHFQLKSGQEI